MSISLSDCRSSRLRNNNDNNTPWPFWLKSWPLVARLEPMASTSSAVGLVRGRVSRPTHVAWCWRGHTCPCHARKCCWFRHDEDVCRDCSCRVSFAARVSARVFVVPPEQIAEVFKVIQQRIVEPIVDEPVPLAEFVGVWEQIVDVPVPRIWEAVYTTVACARSGLWISLCLVSWMQPWMFCFQHHRSACRIVLGSSSLMCQCSTSRRKMPGRSSALENVHCASSSPRQGLHIGHCGSPHQGPGQVQHASSWRCDGASVPRSPRLCGPCGVSGFLVR